MVKWAPLLLTVSPQSTRVMSSRRAKEKEARVESTAIRRAKCRPLLGKLLGCEHCERSIDSSRSSGSGKRGSFVVTFHLVEGDLLLKQHGSSKSKADRENQSDRDLSADHDHRVRRDINTRRTTGQKKERLLQRYQHDHRG